MEIKIKKLIKDAKIPTYATEGDAGMDLFSLESFVIEPNERLQVRTGVAMEIPYGYVGLIWDKSGLSHKHGLKTLGGVVDAGYRGEIMVGVINLSDSPIEFSPGDKVAQMLIQKIELATTVEVSELSDSERGAGGFGSTGRA